MAISVVSPVAPAIETTKQMLFRPFDYSKWLVLGFCAWIAHLGEGGGPNVPNFSGQAGGPGGGGKEGFRELGNWIQANLPLIIGIALAIFLVALAIGLVFTWLSSRFKFIFVDNIIHDRAAVVAPWREFIREGNSLFWFRFLFGL